MRKTAALLLSRPRRKEQGLAPPFGRRVAEEQPRYKRVPNNVLNGMPYRCGCTRCSGRKQGRGYTTIEHVPFPFACRGKDLLRSPPGASKAPSGCQGSAQLLNLSKSNCFPLDFGELPIPNNPGYRDALGLITRDTGPVRGRKDNSHRQARGICHSRFEFVRL